jgi:hypothetical protein
VGRASFRSWRAGDTVDTVDARRRAEELSGRPSFRYLAGERLARLP